MMFGTKDESCPLWQGPCRERKCKFYVQIIGQNPNTGEQINKEDCAIPFLPMLLIENSQQQRQTGASVDKVANEVRKASEQTHTINIALPAAPDLKLINGQ